MSASWLMDPVIHTLPSFPHLSYPPLHTLLPSGLQGDGGGDTCTSNLAVSYLLMTPTDYQSLQLTGECRRTPRLIQRCLRKHSIPHRPGNVVSSLKSTWRHRALSWECPVSCDKQARISRKCIKVFEVNLKSWYILERCCVLMEEEKLNLMGQFI